MGAEVLKDSMCKRQHVKDATEFENAPLSHVHTPLKRICAEPERSKLVISMSEPFNLRACGLQDI
jgi:hypothetical protein